MRLAINKNKKGIAALLTVVIVGAITFLMTYSSVLIGLGELDMASASAGGAKALGVANGCMEETLRRIRIDNLYGVPGPLNFLTPDGSCTIQVALFGGDARIIVVTGTSGSYSKKILSLIGLSGNPKNIISMAYWTERND